MSTKVNMISDPGPASFLPLHSVEALPPDYKTSEDIELTQLGASSSADSLPLYDAVYEDQTEEGEEEAEGTSSLDTPDIFHATKILQIQTRGHPLIALPIPPRPDPIYIHAVAPTGVLGQPEFVSVRHTRRSGSCFLARADDPDLAPLCTTTYRWGPSRPPKIKLLQLTTDDAASGEEIALENKGAFTRAAAMRTPYGSFEWRYSTRAERRAAGPDVDSLLILDRTTTVALEGGSSQVRRRRVGQLVRGGGLRTEGTGRSTAGNGGRLMLDLRGWTERKGEAEQVEVLAVASCVSMLKREVDRRRVHQTMVMCAGASGGS